MKYTYLVINLLALAIPLLYSWDSRIRFRKRWGELFAAIILTMFIFIPWDILFTERGVWHFNEQYLTGVSLLGLPAEEWLFFIAIPYSCVFTFDAMKYFLGNKLSDKYTSVISALLIIMLLTVAVLFHRRIYTLVTFSALAISILVLQFLLRVTYLNVFYMTWSVLLIPFFIVNGILTGTSLAEPVVWYNNTENLGLRIMTIPVEDLFYGMLLILLNVSIYERLLHRRVTAAQKKI